MRKRSLLRFWLPLVVAVVVAGVAWRLMPLFTGPAVPAGATRLHIATQTPNLNMGCATALLQPARVSTSGNDLVLVTVESGESVAVVWPAGFGAWRADGHAVIADAWGSVVGREGDVLESLGGGGSGLDGAFHICPFGIPTRH